MSFTFPETPALSSGYSPPYLPQVVRIRREKKTVVQDCDVYIGRRMTQGGWNLTASKWSNPYVVNKHGTREEVLVLYHNYVLNGPLYNQLDELLSPHRPLLLGCWCRPQACHGDVLIHLLRCRHPEAR